MLRKEIANDQKLQTKNFNALDEEENNAQRTIPAPSITSILPDEIVDQIKSETQEEIKHHSPEEIPHSTMNYWQKFKQVFQTVKTFYSFAIGI
jgi:sRNA-binding carbon storage regulator CsrA